MFADSGWSMWLFDTYQTNEERGIGTLLTPFFVIGRYIQFNMLAAPGVLPDSSFLVPIPHVLPRIS